MFNNAMFPAEVSSMVALITMIYGIDFSEILIKSFIAFVLDIGVEKLSNLLAQRLMNFIKYGISKNSSILVFVIGALYIFYIENMIERRINNHKIDEDSCKKVLESLLEQKNIEKQRQMLENAEE